MPERIEADVCVVGAGYAGLTAARRLSQAGKSVAVLEARNRVGGRCWTEQQAGGWTVDRGAGWIAPDHTAIQGLAKETGTSLYKTYTKGSHLLVGGGRKRKYKGLVPGMGVVPVLTLTRALTKLDRMAKKLPVDAPWDAPRANEWDKTTIAEWFAGCGVRSDVARDLLECVIRGLFTTPLDEVPLLNLLFLIRSAGGFNTLTSIEGGYQENLVEGGAGSIAQKMADELGAAVNLDSPVRAIRQTTDHVEIEAGELTVSASRAVVAVPPALALEIAFDPALTPDRLDLLSNVVAGPETKTLVVYDEPFWRAEGFSGQTAGAKTVAEVTLDASPISGTPGVIAVFTFSHIAAETDALDPAERKSKVIAELVDRFGPRAASPIDFIETAWMEHEWTRGCSMADFAPGMLTKYRSLIREPFDRVHWAGTETASVSYGAMDGAVRSGERAAAEILDRL